MAGTPSRGGRDWAGGTQPGTPASSSSDAAESQRCAGGAANSTSQLGATETARLFATRGAQGSVAGGEQHRRPAATRRAGASAAAAETDTTLHRAAEARLSSESGVVCGFQRMVPHAGWLTLRSAHDYRCLQPILAAVLRSQEDRW